MSFTEDEIIAEAHRRYGKPICVDGMKDALAEPTLQDAVTSILLETVMWDSPTSNCMDSEIWGKMAP